MVGKYPVTVSADLLIRAGVSMTAALRELIACVYRFLHTVAFSVRTPILSNSENTWNCHVELPQPRQAMSVESLSTNCCVNHVREIVFEKARSRRITLKIIKLITNGAIR